MADGSIRHYNPRSGGRFYPPTTHVVADGSVRQGLADGKEQPTHVGSAVSAERLEGGLRAPQTAKTDVV